MNKKAKAFELFSQGFESSSPEVKALGLKANTRYSYFSKWNKAGQPSSLVVPEKPTKAQKAILKKMSLPGGESIQNISEFRSNKVKGGEDIVKEETDKVKEGDTEVKEPESKDDEPQPKVDEPEPKDEKPEGKPQTEKMGILSDGSTQIKQLSGQPVVVTVAISPKTLALYDIARSLNEGQELTMGDFFDTSAEDFFNGRGWDLGLVPVGGKKDGG